jgi:hypothetical protein
MGTLPQRTVCSVEGGCSDIGGPCPSCYCEACEGMGVVPGDPEGDALEECQCCNGSGRCVSKGETR